MVSNSSSIDPAPTVASISRISSSVCGVKVVTRRVYEGVWATAWSARRILKAVLGHQGQIVPLVEDLAPDLRVALAEPPDLAVLLGDQLLVQRRDLDVKVELGQIEIGGEPLDRLPLFVPRDRERGRLVRPGDLIEVEQPRELPLRRVGEPHLVARQWIHRRLCAHAPPAARGRPVPALADPFGFGTAFSTSLHTRSIAIAKTPCP